MPPVRIGRLDWLGGAALISAWAWAGPAAAQVGDLPGGSAPGSGLSDQGSLPPGVPPIDGALLPSTGFDPNQLDLRGHLLGSFGQTTPAGPAGGQAGPNWQISPSISVSEAFTDNADQFGGYNFGTGRRRSDAITLITPAIIVAGTTERFNVNLNYAPTGVIYAVNPDFSQFRQQFSGSVLTTAVPDLFYVDLRGSVGENPVFGGINALNTALLPPSQRETQSNVSLTPYLVHSFGGTGTAQAGVGYIYSATDAPSFLNAGNPTVPLALPFNYGSQYLATRRVFASFTTGQDFGRFQDAIDTDNSFYDGSGASRGAHRILLTDDVSYAINRFVSGLGEIGYENLSYPNSGYSFVGGVWSAGVRVTPNAQSSITVEYRRADGVIAPYVVGYWQISPRVRLFGQYSSGITTFQEDQQNELLSGSVDQTGVAASALVAAPLVNNASLYGANQALTRAERANFNVSYIADRDVITGTYNHQRASVIGNRLGLPSSLLARLGISNAQLAALGLLSTQTSSSTQGTVTWRHDLAPTWSSDVQAGYSRDSIAQTVGGGYDAVQFSAALDKTFSDTLSGRVVYSGNYATSSGAVNGASLNSDTVTFTLRKSF